MTCKCKHCSDRGYVWTMVSPGDYPDPEPPEYADIVCPYCQGASPVRTPAQVIAAVRAEIARRDNLRPLHSSDWWRTASLLNALFVSAAQVRNVKRHAVMRFLVGKDSVTQLTIAESLALENWARSDNAKAEAALIWDAIGETHG